ncbi:hypothetical protein CLU79DRAFT_380601 [Phycomyces nitens]|nr:hypothetical protein CLU79DRAFT_380601 [Phycomyces nitens]
MGPPSETSGGVPLVSYTDDHSIGSEYDLDPTLQRPEQMPLGFSDWGDTDRSSVASEYTPNNLNWEQPQSRTFRQTDSDNLVYQEYRRMRNRTLGAIRSTQGESSETNIDSNDERVSPTQEPLRLLEQLFRQSDMEDTNTPRPAEDGDTSLSNPWNEETSGIVTGPDVDNIFRSGLINSENIRIQEILDIAFGSHMTRRNAQLHDRLFHSSTGGNWDNNYSPEALQNLQEDSESESEEEASIDHEISDRRVPNVVRSTNPTRSDTTRGLVGKQKRREIGEYLVFTTAKDVYLLNPTRPRITTIRVEHEAIAKIDVRSDRMLQAMDRINMVEWIPEIELLVVASQKGVVALTRVLQVELDDGRQTCLFNNECYLPLDGLQPNPLYGMTVQRIVQDHIASPIFHLYLFYYDGTVLGYKLSRNKTVVDVNSFIV